MNTTFLEVVEIDGAVWEVSLRGDPRNGLQLLYRAAAPQAVLSACICPVSTATAESVRDAADGRGDTLRQILGKGFAHRIPAPDGDAGAR